MNVFKRLIQYKMIEHFTKTFSREFVKNSFTIMLGTIVAQGTVVALSPIITRLYSAESMGILTAFISIVSILTVFATGRYELTILLPKHDKNAKSILIGIILLSLLVSFSVLIALSNFGREILQAINKENVVEYLIFLPFSILLVSSNTALYYFLNRKKKYKNIALGKILQTTTNMGFAIISGFILNSPLGLILGYIFGYLFQNIIYTIHALRVRVGQFHFQRTRYMLIRYKKFPIYLLPSGLLEVYAGQAPVILMTSLYSLEYVGYYGLATQVVSAPMSLIARAMTDVFKQQAANDIQFTGHCNQIFNRTFVILFLIGVIPFIILGSYAPQIFGIIFGENWKVAGEFAQILTLMYFLQFVVSPLSSVIFLKEKTKADLYIQIYLSIATTVSFLLGFYMYKSVKVSISLFVFAYTIKYFIEFFYSKKLSLENHANI